MAHQQCIVCRGGKTPDQLDREMHDDYMMSFHDINDDIDFFDHDLDWSPFMQRHVEYDSAYDDDSFYDTNHFE